MCCTWYGRPPAQAVKGIHRLTDPLTNLPPRMIAGFCGMIRQLGPYPPPLLPSIPPSLSPTLSRNINEWYISSHEGFLTPEVPWLLWSNRPTSMLMEQMCDSSGLYTLYHITGCIKNPKVLPWLRAKWSQFNLISRQKWCKFFFFHIFLIQPTIWWNRVDSVRMKLLGPNEMIAWRTCPSLSNRPARVNTACALTAHDRCLQLERRMTEVSESQASCVF